MREKRTEEAIKSDREKAKVGMTKLRKSEEYQEYKEQAGAELCQAQDKLSIVELGPKKVSAKK